MDDTFLQFAHRGGALLAPENTLTAFARGVQYSVNALELDIQLTRDQQIVVIHDATVDRTTDGTGPVAFFPLDQLQQLDAGYRFTRDGKTFPYRGQGIKIPTLDEVLERFPHQLINIDLKSNSPLREQLLWRLLQSYRATARTIVGNDTYRPLQRFRQLTAGQVTTSASQREVLAFLLAARTGTTRFLHPAYSALQVPETSRGIRIVTPTTIRVAHALGIKVHVWTVNERQDMERLLRWGVDGIMTDRPDVLEEVIKES